MTEQPAPSSSNPGNQRDDLKRECYRLIERISYRPGYMKLLAGVRDYLAIAANYKGNRTYRRKK
jgi:hypothetical protein